MQHSSRLPAGLTQQMLREEPLPEGTLDLTQSNPHACALDAAVVLADFLPQVRPGYCPEPLGHGDGRRSVAAQTGRWGRPTDPAAVMLTSSTSEALSFIFKMACDPGAQVACGLPGYPLVPHIAELEGLRVVSYTIAQGPSGHWQLDLDSVRAVLAAGARVVVLVSPGNPTGAYLDGAALAALAALCNRYRALAVFDEVFAPYPVQPPHARLVDVAKFHRAICVGGLSKAALLPEAKVSWLCVYGQPGWVRQAMAGLEWIGDAYLSLGVTAQLVGPILDAAGAAQNALRARVQRAYAHLQALCEASGCVFVDPLTAGWYAVVRPHASAPGVRAAVAAGMDVPGWLLGAAGVHVQPGYLFDLPCERALVASLIVPWQVHQQGWQRAIQALTTGGTVSFVPTQPNAR